MEIDPRTLSARERYRLLISCVIPRPIALVSTQSEARPGSAATPNLAPFSFFGGVTASPPTVMVSVGRRRGEHKDTARNLLTTKEGVVHIPHRPLAEAMVACSAEVDASVDEFDLSGLTPIPSTRVSPPRVAEAAVALEVVLSEHHEVGSSPVDLFLLEVIHVHLADEYLEEGLPAPGSLAAIGRLGGIGYCDTSTPFFLPRPS